MLIIIIIIINIPTLSLSCTHTVCNVSAFMCMRKVLKAHQTCFAISFYCFTWKPLSNCFQCVRRRMTSSVATEGTSAMAFVCECLFFAMFFFSPHCQITGMRDSSVLAYTYNYIVKYIHWNEVNCLNKIKWNAKAHTRTCDTHIEQHITIHIYAK